MDQGSASLEKTATLGKKETMSHSHNQGGPRSLLNTFIKDICGHSAKQLNVREALGNY